VQQQRVFPHIESVLLLLEREREIEREIERARERESERERIIRRTELRQGRTYRRCIRIQERKEARHDEGPAAHVLGFLLYPFVLLGILIAR